MQDAAIVPAAAVMSAGVEQEFEARLGESATLAFRVAFAVLRRRQDAEDVFAIPPVLIEPLAPAREQGVQQ